MEEITMEIATETDQARPYWETIPRSMCENIIRGNIRTIGHKMSEMAALFCTAGYYLRRQLREEQWKETGAANFAEYVQTAYGKSRGWASRMMQINEKYSIGGDDPRISPKYSAFTISQLQEMLYLPEDKADGITPDMTVRQIRQQRPAPEVAPDSAQNEQYFAQDEQKYGTVSAKYGTVSAKYGQNVSQGQQDGQERQQPEEDATITAGFDVSGFATSQKNDDEEAREWAEIVEEVEAEIAEEEAEDAIDNDLKREITRNEWVRMYDVVERRLPEEITADTLKHAINNSGVLRDDFYMDCSYRGVTINRSKTETWATVARNMKAIRAARAQQEAEEAAAAARPGWKDYAEEWGQGPDADADQDAVFCDVAKMAEEDGDDLPEPGAWQMSLPEIVEDEQEGSSQDEGGAAGEIFIGIPEGAAAGTYTRSDVYAFELEARRELEQYRECDRKSAELGYPGLPERLMKKVTIKADAARVLLTLMEIYSSRSYGHADE